MLDYYCKNTGLMLHGMNNAMHVTLVYRGHSVVRLGLLEGLQC